LRSIKQAKFQKYNKGIYPFPIEILKQFEGRRAKAKMDKKDDKDKAEVDNLELRNLEINSDGSLMLCGEVYKHVSHTRYSSGRTYTTHNYFYDDLFIMRIDTDGELHWMRKIPKSRHGRQGRQGMSFKYFGHNGDSYFFFLDNKANLNLPARMKPQSATWMARAVS